MAGERHGPASERGVALVDLVDRALNAGVVVHGDITISLADVDLVYLNLRLLLGSVPTLRRDLADTLEEGRSALDAATEGRAALEASSREGQATLDATPEEAR